MQVTVEKVKENGAMGWALERKVGLSCWVGRYMTLYVDGKDLVQRGQRKL